MRFEYCCKDMMEFMGEVADINPDMTIEFEGWTFDYCPFCGERIEVVSFIHGEKQEESE